MTSREVEEQTLETFMQGESGRVKWYLGAHTKGSISKQQRERIIDVARQLKGLPYIEENKVLQFVVQLKYDPWDDDADGLLDADEISNLRCDGFVEYCYAAGAGVDIAGMDILRNPEKYNETEIRYIIIPGMGEVPIPVPITKYTPRKQRFSMQSSIIQNPTKAHTFNCDRQPTNGQMMIL